MGAHTVAARRTFLPPCLRPLRLVAAAAGFACLVALVEAQPAPAACVRDSYGNVICGRGQCALDQYGKVYCAKEGGGAVRNNFGVVVCGAGYCATDDQGRVRCSTTPGGGAAMDSYGQVKCTGACKDASPQMCEEGR